MTVPVGLICGIIKDEFQADVLGTLEKIAEIGYKGIEVGKSLKSTNVPVQKIRKKLDELNMEAICCHVLINDLKNDFDGIIAASEELGFKFVDLVWSPCDSKEWILEAAAIINDVGEKFKKKGLQLTYHNHDHEFKNVFDGERAIDILYANTHPEFLQAEVDVAWVKYGGMDPVEFINKYKGRCPLLHLKDIRDLNERAAFIELGSGIIDFKSIAKAAEENGAKWFVVEQDRPYKLPGMESIKVSYNYLKEIGLV